MNSDQIPPTLDLQLILNNGLDDVSINHLIEEIKTEGGVVREGIYYLSDNTPVIRVIIPSRLLVQYKSSSMIYRIEETEFYSLSVVKEPKGSTNSHSLLSALALNTNS